jgi:cytochrome P450
MMRVQEHSLLDADIQESPFEYYRALREQAPVYFMPEIEAFVITRYRDVQHVLLHPEIWSNDLLVRAGFSMFQHSEAKDLLEQQGWVRDTRLQSDPPIHRDYRQLVAAHFTAGRVKQLGPWIRELAHGLAEALVEEDECEFMSTFAAQLPIRVITRVLGLPSEDSDQIKVWSDAWVEPLTAGISLEREVEVARLGVALQQYLATWMKRKEDEPDEDVLTALSRATFPDGTALPMAEKMGLAEHLIVGGHETATSALGSGVMLLAQHPEVAAELREKPQKIRNFVEEVLRLESPSQGFFRVAVVDSEIAGVQIPRGQLVHVRFAAANRDPDSFPSPDALDLERSNAGAHVALGQGEHHCIGAPLARLELRSAFEVLLERFSHIELSPGASLEHLPGLALRTLKQLTIQTPLARRGSPRKGAR